MNHNQAQGDLAARIEQLLIYPVKSCAGVALPEVLLTDTGLDLDRAWMVVDADGEFVTQREAPRLALVQPQLKTDHLVLRAPGMLALHIAIDRVEQPLTVRVWDDLVPAYDLGALAGQWITDFLAQPHLGDARPPVGPCRLVRFDPAHRRLSGLKWTGGLEAPNQFSDGFPLLVLSQASLDGLNQRLAAGGQAPVPMARFRPNIVLSGLQAHDEDRLAWLHLATDSGLVRLKLVKPCPRCPIPNIDPATALSHPAVGDALQGYRQDARVGGAVTFGMNAIVCEGDGVVLRLGHVLQGDLDFA
ncbi:MAG: MOSC N-terminal beta barrel domain-containing protein [Betaproteobacteria bacterium]